MVLRYLKDEIRSKHVGSPLPPVGEIRKTLGVSQLSVQRAYDFLETRGRISRQPRKGIFICDHTQSGEFAIVVRPVFLGPSASPYYSLTCNALVEMTHERRPGVEARMHLGKPAPTEREYAQTLDLLEPHVVAKLRGVFAFHPLFDVSRKLYELGVPVVSMGSIEGRHGEHAVYFDTENGIRQYAQALARGGCKTVGIVGIPLGNDPDMYEDGISTLGLQTKSEWLIRCHAYKDLSIKGGYEQFMQLWNCDTRPDGVIVLDDVMCRGVLQGCLQLGVDLPTDLQLVSHANKGVEFPYHKPVTRVEFDAVEQARHAVDLSIRLLRGETPPMTICIPGVPVAGRTTAELSK